MKAEYITQRPWIIFLLATTNLGFLLVLNAAGTGAGNFGIGTDEFGPSIRLRKLYILNVQTPEFPIASNSTAGPADNFQLSGWAGYLYLNGACIGPAAGQSVDARDGMIGARCQKPRIAERYFISTRPNLTQGIADPQIVCYQGKPNTTVTWITNDNALPCDLDENAAWPRYLISLAAPWSLLLLATIATCITILLRFTCIRVRIPYKHLVDIANTSLSAFFLLFAATMLTSDAIDVRDWVNGQHAELVHDARIGVRFFLLLWLAFGLTLVKLAILVLVDHVKNKKKITEPESEEPPGYDAVTTQISIDPMSELMRR